MSRLIRRALQYSQMGLTKVNNKIERFLNGRPHSHPYIRNLAEAYACEWTLCPCVFVLSTGRVGTKTLAALFALSPFLLAKHEPEPVLIKAFFDSYMESGEIRTNGKWQAVVSAARDDAVCAASRRGKIYVETNPRLTYLAKALSVSFPASRFIHLHRHPYEVIRSKMRRRHYEGHSLDFARIRPRPGEPAAEEWATLTPLEKNAWNWARLNGDVRDFFSTLPESRKMDLRADALFAGDEAVLTRLFAFVGVDMPPRESIEEVLGLKINSARKGAFPHHSQWSDAQRQLLWDRVSGVAVSLGYQG